MVVAISTVLIAIDSNSLRSPKEGRGLSGGKEERG